MIISFYYFELTDSVKLFDRPPYGRRLVNILPLYCKEIDIGLCVTCKKKAIFTASINLMKQICYQIGKMVGVG